MKDNIKGIAIAEQISKTNKSAALLVERVGAGSAMQLLELFSGETLVFPKESTLRRAVLVVLIDTELYKTKENTPERKVAAQTTQDKLKKIDRIFLIIFWRCRAR